MTQVSPGLDELRRIVEAEIEGFLDERGSSLPEAGLLLDEIRRMVAAGGKRLRPAFCYWGYRACGGRHARPIVRASAALEVLHTFALVHDDIMDSARERRGQPTTVAKHGAAVAILVGDFALVLADALFFSSGFEHSRLLSAFEVYSEMRQQVIAGQHLDLAASGASVIGEEDARRIAVMKSGRYSVEHPLVIGARLAGGSEEVLRCLSSFGSCVGEAFQLHDDLLGTFGDPGAMGKPVDSDIREGKRNLLYVKTLALLNEPERSEFVAGWGRGSDLDDRGVARLRELVEVSGARAATERLAEDLRARAIRELERCAVEVDADFALTELARLATGDG